MELLILFMLAFDYIAYLLEQKLDVWGEQGASCQHRLDAWGEFLKFK